VFPGQRGKLLQFFLLPFQGIATLTLVPPSPLPLEVGRKERALSERARERGRREREKVNRNGGLSSSKTMALFIALVG